MAMQSSMLRSTELRSGVFTANRSGKSLNQTTRRTISPVCALPTDQIKQTAIAAAAALALLVAPSPAQALCPDLITAPDGLQVR